MKRGGSNGRECSKSAVNAGGEAGKTGVPPGDGISTLNSFQKTQTRPANRRDAFCKRRIAFCNWKRGRALTTGL